jgi:hypothetical protein
MLQLPMTEHPIENHRLGPRSRNVTRIARWILPAAALTGTLIGCDKADRVANEIPIAQAILLRGVTIVDTRTGSLASNMSILMNAGRIVSIAPTDAHSADASTTTIDATGKFVVPGYLEMHAHPLDRDDPSGSLELMLVNGITGFRQMTGSPELLKERQNGTLPIPRDSPALLALPGSILTPLNAATPEAAVATVREEHDAGADFIKVGFVTPSAFFPAQAEAKRLGIPIVGHLPTGIDVAAASKGGMKSIEHLGPGVGILAACSSDEAGVRDEMAKRPGLKMPPFKIPFGEQLLGLKLRKLVVNPLAESDPADVGILRHSIDTFSDEKCRLLAAHFVRDGTWQVPTLIRLKTSELGDAAEFSSDPNLRFVALKTVDSWRERTRVYATLSADIRDTYRDAYRVQLRITKLFDEAGVKMMAGSDVSGAGWEVPGFSLHQEFDELQRAGLSPLHVLQMTTLNAAEFLGRTSNLGSVEPNKAADLVLLDANPIESVQNLHKIYAVIRSGFYYSPDHLKSIEDHVQADRSVQ